MKKILTQKFWFTLSVMFVSLTGAYAQQLNTTGLYRHGTNSTSAGVAVAPEATDSVTVGGKMDYFVMPDALYNPLYVPATSLTANLVSTFTWSTNPAGPGIATKTGFGQNYVTVTWPATAAIYTLNVKENGGTCNDVTGKDISVNVINAPTANFGSATSTQCTATPATLNFTLPLTLNTDINNGRMVVNISIKYTTTLGVATTTAYNNIAVTESGTLNLETVTGALAYGKYEVTIVSVRDRISVKSNVTGVIGTTPTYTYNVIRLPQTGEIYHIPNI
jgi:hypothetical protein